MYLYSRFVLENRLEILNSELMIQPFFLIDFEKRVYQWIYFIQGVPLKT